MTQPEPVSWAIDPPDGRDHRREYPQEDLAARLGGEEFALLLPGSDADAGRRVCERLRSAVASRLFELPDGGALRVTLSTGVALLGSDEDAGALMQRSDEALYEAKGSGRNQVRLAA